MMVCHAYNNVITLHAVMQSTMLSPYLQHAKHQSIKIHDHMCTQIIYEFAGANS
jgi:hypothetical protein